MTLPRPGVPARLPKRARSRAHARNLRAVLRGSIKCSAFDRKQIQAAADHLEEIGYSYDHPDQP